MAKKYGPFTEYTEVDTPHGTFGLVPGQVLTFAADGAANVAQPDTNVDELSALDKAGLIDVAKQRGVEFSGGWTKARIRDAILEAEK